MRIWTRLLAVVGAHVLEQAVLLCASAEVKDKLKEIAVFFKVLRALDDNSLKTLEGRFAQDLAIEKQIDSQLLFNV